MSSTQLGSPIAEWESCSSIPDSRDEGGGHGSVGPGWAPPPPPPWPISEVAIGIRDEIRDEGNSQDEAEEHEAKDEENKEDEDEGMVARAVLPVLSRHALANAWGKIAPGEARD